MSMMACSYCGEFRDTDDGEGMWDVPKFCHPRRTSPKVYDFVCGVCCDQYITEDGELDEDLPEKMHMLDQGDRMAAIAEDQSIVDAQCVRAAFYVMDSINGREGSDEGREALKQILQTAMSK
jgi:hypothetical protein